MKARVWQQCARLHQCVSGPPELYFITCKSDLRAQSFVGGEKATGCKIDHLNLSWRFASWHRRKFINTFLSDSGLLTCFYKVRNSSFLNFASYNNYSLSDLFMLKNWIAFNFTKSVITWPSNSNDIYWLTYITSKILTFFAFTAAVQRYILNS